MPALVARVRELEGRLEIAKEALKNDCLTDIAKLLCLGLVIDPQEPNEADLEWARQRIEELRL